MKTAAGQGSVIFHLFRRVLAIPETTKILTDFHATGLFLFPQIRWRF
jgi:hypothetical protein